MRARTSIGLLVGALAVLGAARADDEAGPRTEGSTLVKQASAPLSNILQLRLQDSYLPEFTGSDGQGNVLTVSITMPLPRYRLLPLPQLSLLTMPTAVTTPGGITGLGDLRFLDIVVVDPGRRLLWGIGPALVLPTATAETTGQGQWQAGPAAAIAFTPGRWLAGVIAQNPIAFAGDRGRRDANALFLQPFATYQLGSGWFVRSQPQLVFNWVSGKQVIPVDVGVGRVVDLGRQHVSCFVEPFWNASADGPTPRYGVTFGVALLYPEFWQASRAAIEPRT